MSNKRRLNDFEDQELIDICNEYSDTHFTFNNDFASSLQDWLHHHDELTEGQRDALIYIIEKHHMDY